MREPRGDETGQTVLPGLDGVAALAAMFVDFPLAARHKLPLYGYLSERIEADHEVVARLLLAHPDQRIPNLLFAAVHDVLLAGDGDGAELGAWYGSITDPVRPIGEGEDDPWPHFRRLALEHPDVEHNLRTRSTQTNEIGRCCALLPALAQVSATAPGSPDDGTRPLGLVEIGASAGLNLLLDRYGYCYRSAESAGSTSGQVEVNGGAFVTLACELRGDVAAPIPTVVPELASRVGLDLHPVDLSKRADARWLVACQWPDQPERLHRARSAVALARGDHPQVLQGDAVDDLAPLAAGVGEHALPVVIATWVLAYLDATRQVELLAVLDALGADRDLTMVFAEAPNQVPALGIPPRPDGAPDGPATALVRLDWRDGARTATRLADMHPHGTWIEWLAD